MHQVTHHGPLGGAVLAQVGLHERRRRLRELGEHELAALALMRITTVGIGREQGCVGLLETTREVPALIDPAVLIALGIAPENRELIGLDRAVVIGIVAPEKRQEVGRGAAVEFFA